MHLKMALGVDDGHQDGPRRTRRRCEVLGQVQQSRADLVGTGTGPGGANVCETGWTWGHVGTSSPPSSSRMDN